MNLRKAFSYNYSVVKQEHDSGYFVTHNLHKQGDELHYAAEIGHLEMMDYYLNQDPQALNRLHSSQGTTPICWSISSKQDAATNKLLDRGANLLRAGKPFKHYFPVSFISSDFILSSTEKRIIHKLRADATSSLPYLETLDLIELTEWLHVYIMTVDLSIDFPAEGSISNFKYVVETLRHYKTVAGSSLAGLSYLISLLMNVKTALSRFSFKHPEFIETALLEKYVTDTIDQLIVLTELKDFIDDDLSFALYSPNSELMLSDIEKHSPVYTRKALDYNSGEDDYYCIALNLQNARNAAYQLEDAFEFANEALELLSTKRIINDDLGRLLAYTAIDCQHIAETPEHNAIILKLLINSCNSQFIHKSMATCWLTKLLKAEAASFSNRFTELYAALDELLIDDFDFGTKSNEFHDLHILVAKSVLKKMLAVNIASLSSDLMLAPSETSMQAEEIDFRFKILIQCVKLRKKCYPKLKISSYVERHFSSLALLLPEGFLQRYALIFLPLKSVYEKIHNTSLDYEVLEMLTQHLVDAIYAGSWSVIHYSELLEQYYHSTTDYDSKAMMKKFKKLFQCLDGAMIETRDGLAGFFEDCKTAINSGNNYLAKIYYTLADHTMARLRVRHVDLAPFKLASIADREYFISTHNQIKFDYFILYTHASMSTLGMFSTQNRLVPDEKKETSRLNGATNDMRLG